MIICAGLLLKHAWRPFLKSGFDSSLGSTVGRMTTISECLYLGFFTGFEGCSRSRP